MMISIIEFQKFHKALRKASLIIHRGNKICVVPKIKLKDGTYLSVQASSTHYCHPRVTDCTTNFDTFEVWFPGDNEPEGWVTPQKIIEFINSAGGIVGGPYAP
jgi:hypothetical protein